MIECLLGSKSREQVLLFIVARGDGYAREISRFFDTDYRPIRDQLRKLEDCGVLISRSKGKTVVYSMNPRCPYGKELISVIQKVITFSSHDLRDRLLLNRRRPRKRGKPV